MNESVSLHAETGSQVNFGVWQEKIYICLNKASVSKMMDGKIVVYIIRIFHRQVKIMRSNLRSHVEWNLKTNKTNTTCSK